MNNVFCGSTGESVEAREWLISHLRAGEVDVIFTKKDGTDRTMKCTLKEGTIIHYERKTEKTKEKSNDILSVWDIEKSAWRSFRWDSIKSVLLHV